MAPILGQKIGVEPEISQGRLKMLRDYEEAERVAAWIEAALHTRDTDGGFLIPQEWVIEWRAFPDDLTYEEMIHGRPTREIQ